MGKSIEIRLKDEIKFIVIFYIKIIGDKMSDIGFNINNKESIFIIGGVMTTALMILGYVI